jgi:hypothetical protein
MDNMVISFGTSKTDNGNSGKEQRIVDPICPDCSLELSAMSVNVSLTTMVGGDAVMLFQCNPQHCGFEFYANEEELLAIKAGNFNFCK